jgi:hypothetical protein
VNPKVLALIENNIAMELLLETRLKGLGYQVTILSAPVIFQKHLEAESFDWIILDEASVPPDHRRFLEHLQRHRKEARLVWCGKIPRWTSLAIEATFKKPLRYDAIGHYFSERIPPGLQRASNLENAVPLDAAGEPEGLVSIAEEGSQNNHGGTRGPHATTATEGREDQ